MLRTIYIYFTVLLVLVSSAVAYGQTSNMTWSVSSNLQLPRDSGAALTAPGGTIYVLGGNTAQPTTVESLTPGGTSWTNATALSTPRMGTCATQFGSGSPLIAVIGGKDGRRAVRDLTSYNPGIGGSNVRSMITARYLHACTLDALGTIYALGGKDSLENPTATVERFFGGRWVGITNLPEPRFDFAAASDGRGNILTFGGSTSSKTATNVVNRFDGSVWDTAAPMLIATSGSAVVSGANKLIYVIGGAADGVPVTSVQIYHIETDSWTLGTPLPVAVTNASATVDSTGNVLVIGGITTAGSNVSTVWASPQESAPPVILTSPNTFAVVGGQYSYQLNSSGNPSPTYSLTTAPDGMTIEGSSGLITWSPTITQIGPHDVTVHASNLAGSIDQSFVVSVTPPAPTGLIASNVTANGLSLEWNPLPAEAGVVTYEVDECVRRSRSGCAFALVAGGLSTTSTNVTGLVAGTSHTYFVKAIINGLASALSPPASIVTLQPATPTNFTVTGQTQNSVTLSWLAPGSSPVPVVGYRIYEFISTTGLVVTVDNITDTTTTVTGLLANSSHLFYVASLDANLNQSILNGPLSVTTSSLPVLVHDPAFPRAVGGGYYNEALVGTVGDRLTLVSADAHSSAYVDFVVRALGVPAASFSMVSGPAGMTIDPLTGVVTWNQVSGPIGTFFATVRGTNSQGFGDLTFSYTVFPQGTDLLSPTTVPMFQAVVSDVTQSSATISWPASADNVAIAGYRIYAVTPMLPCGTRTGCPPLPKVDPVATTDGLTTSVTLNKLNRGAGYTYWIEAVDAAGNTSFVVQGVQRTFITLP